jgi:hypothetical protein
MLRVSRELAGLEYPFLFVVLSKFPPVISRAYVAWPPTTPFAYCTVTVYCTLSSCVNAMHELVVCCKNTNLLEIFIFVEIYENF